MTTQDLNYRCEAISLVTASKNLAYLSILTRVKGSKKIDLAITYFCKMFIESTR